MLPMRLALLVTLALATAGCGAMEQTRGLVPRRTTAYRQVVSANDRLRLRDWRTAFVDGLAAARKAGHGAEIDREGALLDPDAAQTNPAIPNGMYRCRVIKLGAQGPGNLDFVEYPGFTCRVRQDRNLQRLAKLTGSQRYVGLIFPGDPLRNVYLGTLAFADEERVLQYGQDDQRDVAGYVERIGPSRWRLIMPYPHFESHVDVMELTPAQ
jgi:hypothetical protein